MDSASRGPAFHTSKHGMVVMVYAIARHGSCRESMVERKSDERNVSAAPPPPVQETSSTRHPDTFASSLTFKLTLPPGANCNPQTLQANFLPACRPIWKRCRG